MDFEAKPGLADKIRRLVVTTSVETWTAGEFAERRAALVQEFDGALVDAVPTRELEAKLSGRPELIAAQVDGRG